MLVPLIWLVQVVGVVVFLGFFLKSSRLKRSCESRGKVVEGTVCRGSSLDTQELGKNSALISLHLSQIKEELLDKRWRFAALAIAIVGEIAILGQAGLLWLQTKNQERLIEQQWESMRLVSRHSLIDSRLATEVKRNRLLETIYNCDQNSSETSEVALPQEPCVPVAGHRVREQAVRDLVKLQKQLGEPVDLSRSSLSDLDFRYVDLSGAYLIDSDLRGADFSWATLDEVKMQGSDLRSAGFKRTSLDGADLNNVKLDFESTLAYASLYKANLSGANLTGVDLTGAILVEAKVRGATFSRARLLKTNLLQADFSGAILFNADLTQALGLTKEQLESGFGDETTLGPDYLAEPKWDIPSSEVDLVRSSPDTRDPRGSP